jgi:hypothetical protein
VVTAAHCCDVGSSSRVIEARPRDQVIALSGEQGVYADLVDIHTGYRRSGNVNDVCVLHLPSPLPGGVPVPALPSAQALTSPAQCINPTIAGFGLTENNTHGVLLQTSDFRITRVTTSQVAYNQPNSGPCSGDSGGPLYCGDHVAALTTYGDAQCRVNGVSTSLYNPVVAAMLDAYTSGPEPEPEPSGSECGNGTCEQGESCDGRSGTMRCSDCRGRSSPRYRAYCFVGENCVGRGCRYVD